MAINGFLLINIIGPFDGNIAMPSTVIGNSEKKHIETKTHPQTHSKTPQTPTHTSSLYPSLPMLHPPGTYSKESGADRIEPLWRTLRPGGCRSIKDLCIIY